MSTREELNKRAITGESSKFDQWLDVSAWNRIHCGRMVGPYKKAESEIREEIEKSEVLSRHKKQLDTMFHGTPQCTHFVDPAYSFDGLNFEKVIDSSIRSKMAGKNLNNHIQIRVVSVDNRGDRVELIRQLVNTIDRLRWLLSPNVSKILINTEHNDQASLSVGMDDDGYGIAVLNVTDDFLMESEEIQLRFFIHEMVHTHTNLMYSYTVERLTENTQPEDLKKEIKHQLMIRLEAATTSLESLIYYLLAR
ncbi:MAG: hypothetical protein BWY95_00207 [Bacteroidetes bacterium ADurb.BinA104]|nr:MAG: hypothetical protein BWY95_00207 [Bacteroidetes bacterium ADurb.BinA104]